MESLSPSRSLMMSLSPLQRAGRSPGSRRNPENMPEDSVTLGRSEEKPFSAKPWAALGIGVLGLLSATPVVAQVVQNPQTTSQSQRFLEVALGRGEQAPRGQALEVIREYVKTDFGKEMIGKVLTDFDQALAKGWVTPQGELTEEGEFAGFNPFRIVHGPTAQASLREIQLPERFASHFSGSGLEIFPLAILHHEFGHTQFGMPPGPDDIITDQHGSRLRVEHEMEIVRRFENPVRERYGYKPRTSYHNHLGERAGN